MIAEVDYSLIPERVMQNLLAYVKHEEAPGGFLYAVLSNDLFRAVGRADNEMKPLIPLLVHYIHWQVPGNCHGSPEMVKAWMEKK
jgi:hypothetical protein